MVRRIHRCPARSPGALLKWTGRIRREPPSSPDIAQRRVGETAGPVCWSCDGAGAFAFGVREDWLPRRSAATVSPSQLHSHFLQPNTSTYIVAPSTMRFRPCIDIHAGEVKQIVGSTLTDGEGAAPVTNFVASQSAGDFARMYRKDGLVGGHVIMLGASEANTNAALEALQAYPGGLQRPNAVVTVARRHQRRQLPVFRGAGCEPRDRHVLRVPRRPDRLRATGEDQAAHRQGAPGPGPELPQEGGGQQVLRHDGSLAEVHHHVHRDDLDFVERIGNGKVDLSIGSALDIFGGDILYADVVAWDKKRAEED
ncbi:hypothetical protein ON010_g10911 [Phytophthora cinnamomi]|nr:hypothetical protein ON010_g10911 [Phytophthora cinnamomi]